MVTLLQHLMYVNIEIQMEKNRKIKKVFYNINML